MRPLPADHAPFDRDRILAVLAAHQVEYVLVGGVAAASHGATHPTFDFDCLARRTTPNLTRLAAAMRQLNARLRAEGLDDETSQQLGTPIDAAFLAAIEISTWRTDAGDFDVLVNIPGRTGIRMVYDDLLPRTQRLRVGDIEVTVAGLDDIIASKEWIDRPKDRRALPELHALARNQATQHQPRNHNRDRPDPGLSR